MTRGTGIAPAESFVDFLRARGVPAATSRAARRDDGSTIGEMESAWRSGRAPGPDLAALACEWYELPRADYEAMGAVAFAHEALSLQFLREAFALPFRDGEVLWLAVADPGAEEAIQAVTLELGAVTRL